MVASKHSHRTGKFEERSNTPVKETALSDISTPDVSACFDIATDGDLVLQVDHESSDSIATYRFRVSTTKLKIASRYFQNLFHSGRFAEAKDIEAAHERLRQRYPEIGKTPWAELPVIKVQELGRISAVKALHNLLTDFFLILHDKSAQTAPPAANLANLAVVADRFDALPSLRSYMQRKKIFETIDGRTAPKVEAGLNEEKVRQRLLAALLLEHGPWVTRYSSYLIVKGWVGNEIDTSTPLWWDLPMRVEDELSYRRDCILETVQSLLSSFAQLYASRDRQCGLGYDSSAQCDSFQLGEMARFFLRTGLLRLQGALLDIKEPGAAYTGDLTGLLDTLRQVPEYQIDRFHAHCGLRTRLMPILKDIEDALQHVGLCFDCWKEDRAQSAWSEAHPPLIWKLETSRLKLLDHGNRHADVRNMFMASERAWNL